MIGAIAVLIIFAVIAVLGLWVLCLVADFILDVI